MSKLFKVIVIVLFVGSLSACLGSYALTKKLYHWNLEATEDPWVNSGIHAVVVYFAQVMLIVPDALILNSIEFWSGTNPLTGEPAVNHPPNVEAKSTKQATRTVYGLEGGLVEMSLQADGSIRVVGKKDGRTLGTFYLYKEDGVITARSPDGSVIAMANMEDYSG